VPEGSEGLILVRFSAVSTCIGGIGGICRVRALVDEAEAAPALGTESIFAQAEPWLGPWHFSGRTLERSMAGLPPGDHAVEIQFQNDPGVSFEFQGWHLVAEVIAE
jgi:hypothetical protein